jgi:hypothetical protein
MQILNIKTKLNKIHSEGEFIYNNYRKIDLEIVNKSFKFLFNVLLSLI